MTVYWQAPDVTLHHGDVRAQIGATQAPLVGATA